MSLRKKIDYYWWVIFWWSPTVITIFGGLYAELFLDKHLQTLYVFYLPAICFIIGLLGLIILRLNLTFKIIQTKLSQNDNHELILKAIKELKWKQIKITKSKIVVSEKGHDIIPGQIITIIPVENKILFNCIHTTHRFTDPSKKKANYRKFETIIKESFSKDNEH